MEVKNVDLEVEWRTAGRTASRAALENNGLLMANHDDFERDFALSLPPALLSISPSLAYVHAARTRRLYPEVPSLELDFCCECQAYLRDGIGAHRTTRSGARSKRARVKAVSRQLRVHCTACGTDNTLELPVDKESVSQFPMPRARTRALALSEARAPADPQAEAVEHPPTPSVSEQVSRTTEIASRSATPRSASSSGPNAQDKPKKRPKNKAGLQELLARKKQADSSKAATPQNALSSFLSEL